MEQGSRKSGRPKERQSLAHMPLANAARADRDNATADIAALQRTQDGQAAKKKLRGKSIGPGGLEALKETSGNAIKGDPTLTLKSILKPAIPLTPPKVIPSFDELRKRSTGKSKSPGKGNEDLLIDFSTPGPSRAQNGNVVVSGAENVLDPFSPIRQEENEDRSENAQATEDDKQVELKRQAEKQAVLDRRAARRKSLANRRVSFAPEATLHTWSVMELAEDSTTSSASNSTRRQSSMTAQQSPNKASSPASTSSGRPTTPPEQPEGPQVAASPAHQRDLHQKKRRRTSSTGPEAQLEGAVEEPLSSSPADGTVTESSPVRIDDSAESDSDDDTDGDTAMSMDELTSHSVISEDASSTQSSLDERLRQAASQAGTRGIGYDEHGDDLAMEMATATVTNAFQPWAKNAVLGDNSAMQDQENVNPFSPAFKANQIQQQSPENEDNQDETQDMSMDVTRAVGGIIKSSSPAKGRRKSIAKGRRSSVARRRSSGDGSQYGDETMDFTTVGGGILANDQEVAVEDEGDEDLSMEFTSAVGGVLGSRNRRESTLPIETGENETMDMTAAMGGILGTIEEQTEPQTDVEDDRITAMEMTKAIGKIMPAHSTPGKKTQAKQLMLEETSEGQLDLSPQPETLHQGPVASIATETGSPDITLKPRLSGRSRPNANSLSTTPQFSPKRGTPVKSASRIGEATPTKQITPLPTQAATPDKTPLSANLTRRGASPKKLFREEIKARSSPASGRKPQGLFSRDEHTGRQTPSVVLKAPKIRPQSHRRSSGVGIDQEGYGSPQVTQMLDRRTSIGEAAPSFQLDIKSKKELRFQNPRQLEQEVDAERADEERRESGRFLMEQEANERQEENATLQLKEMIESMTPKKDKSSRLKGRKSLAVGAAKGLLGKRPAELDLDDEDGESTPKRLKAVEREGSPIKKVHLPKPPSKEETTGRLTRSEQRQLENMHQGSTTPKMSASPVKRTAISPHTVGRYMDLPTDGQKERLESFEEKMDNVVGAIDIATVHMEKDQASEAPQISLQEFLSMTNIHFIELSATKRRHTMAQSTPKRASEEAADRSTETTFVAAATTLPLLELYQHATRELKSYISTGRKIIRSIEAETLAEQPPLFREYVDARADVKSIMDNQFKNGKTNARYQSKEGWYTWRAQLVEGLKNGLEGIKKSMEADLSLLEQQGSSLAGIVPGLLKQQQSLQAELEMLQQSLSELESVDTGALEQARRELQAADEEHVQKMDLLEALRQQMSDKEEALGSAEELRVEMEHQIAEADRVRQEFRGWPVADVLALKAKVDAIEKETGWRLVGAEEDEEDDSSFGVGLTMMFRDQLRLFFYPSVYQVGPAGDKRRRSGRNSRSVSGPNAPISLTYAPAEDDKSMPVELSTEKRFFLQLIRSQLQAFSMMPKGSVTAKTLLDTVAKGWDMASKVEREIKLLNMAGITTTSILGDERLGVRVMLILSEKSRIDVEFALLVAILNDGELSASSPVSATGVYGPKANLLAGGKSRKVQAALSKEVESKELGSGAWIGAIHGFEDWLTAQSQSQPAPEPVKQVVKEALALAPAPRLDIPPPVVSEIKRSPLAPKNINVVKKALPRPTKPRQTINFRASQNDKSYVSDPTMPAGKENQPPSNPFGAKNLDGSNDQPVKETMEWVSPSKVPRPAILPEEQERMMAFGTPVKRVGALRRSPM